MSPVIEPVFAPPTEQKIDFGQYIINKNNITNYYNQMTSMVSNSTKLISSMVKMSKENLIAKAKQRKENWDHQSRMLSIQQANADRAERKQRQAEADERRRKAEEEAIKAAAARKRALALEKEIKQQEREIAQALQEQDAAAAAEAQRVKDALDQKRDEIREFLSDFNIRDSVFLQIMGGGQ
tara:strand:+ start:1008 stop:1553 length:546 start_codon:yes stop_codon:yes gene_type:complete